MNALQKLLSTLYLVEGGLGPTCLGRPLPQGNALGKERPTSSTATVRSALAMSGSSLPFPHGPMEDFRKCVCVCVCVCVSASSLPSPSPSPSPSSSYPSFLLLYPLLGREMFLHSDCNILHAYSFTYTSLENFTAFHPPFSPFIHNFTFPSPLTCTNRPI